MRTKLISILLTSMFGLITYGQIEIHDMGTIVESPDIELTGTPGDDDLTYKEYYVINTSEGTVELNWSRHNLGGSTCLDDQVCTGINCYVPADDGVMVFNSVEPAVIAPGDSVYLKLGGKSDVNCCAIFRYYLSTGLGTIQDSIDVKYKIGDVDCFLSAEEETKAEISVFPNPANNAFNIVMSNASQETYSVELFNLVGERVLVENLVNGQNTIDVSTLPAGVYFYTIFDGQSTVETKKLIVRH